MMQSGVGSRLPNFAQLSIGYVTNKNNTFYKVSIRSEFPGHYDLM